LCLAWSLPTPAQAQNAKDSAGLLRELLAVPAPFPKSEGKADVERPPEFFEKNKVPPDDAQLEDLQAFWLQWAAHDKHFEPSEVVQRRLLEACADNLEILPGYLRVLSVNETNARRVKELFDRAATAPEEGWRQETREWLVLNSKYFLSELIARANKAKDFEKSGSVRSAEAVTALARVDWSSAEPLLKRLASSGQPRAAALAISLFYFHAAHEKDSSNEEGYRTQLRAIAADRAAPGRARLTALDALADSDWPGRDEWYLSQFQDGTLIDLPETNGNSSPLVTLANEDPEKWIPQLAKLVESKDLTARTAAASCLLSIEDVEHRKAAIKPLLPWLSDPAWAKDEQDRRLRLIQRLVDVDLPESVPGLINIVSTDAESPMNRAFAAQMLAQFKDPRAVPVLKKALAAEKTFYFRQLLIKGLIACGGVPEAEQVEGMEALAERLMGPGGREGIYASDEPPPLPVSIGEFLSQEGNASESVVRAVLSRVDELKKSNPALADSLLRIIHALRGSQVDRDLIQRLATGNADAKTIVNILERRSQLRENLKDDLLGLVNIEGVAQGIGAVLLEDIDLSVNLLGSEKPAAQAAVLLGARLTRTNLPTGEVIPLLKSKDALVAAAAERYLLTEDSKEAREALWKLHPRESFITGWREQFDFLGQKAEFLDKSEKELRAEFGKEDSPVETYVLFGVYDESRSIVRVYPDRAVFTNAKDSSRYTERTITKEELSTFREFVRSHELMELGVQISVCHHQCITSEFLMLTREKGRRVFCMGGFDNWLEVIESFNKLGRGENLKTHYKFENDIKGIEVLYRDEKQIVEDVWQKGAEVRLQVRRAETPEEDNKETLQTDEEEEDEGSEDAVLEYMLQERADQRARYSWRLLKNESAEEMSSLPEGFSVVNEERFPLSEEELRAYMTERRGVFISADSIVFGYDGLWRQSAGQKPVRISTEDGWYLKPVPTGDGKWVVVARSESPGRGVNHLARFNLQTGRESRINIPTADQILPIVYLPSHKKVLVSRVARAPSIYSGAKRAGPDRPEYYLIDAATGQSNLVTGEFEPLLEEGNRFLQPTGKPNEYWAAIADEAKGNTRIGRYNTRDFTLQQVMVVPHISFGSLNMWVDELSSKLYVVYKGDLLRLPLKSTQ